MNELTTEDSRVKNLLSMVSRAARAVALGLLVMVAVACMATVFGITPNALKSTPWLGPLVVHSTMLAASLFIIAILSRGRLQTYGFRFPVGWSWLWRAVGISLATGVLGSALLALLPAQGLPDVPGLSFIQIVLFVWLYASVCEEVLVRGLVQGFVSPFGHHGISLSGIRLSLPVLTGALFFALMHLPALGPGIQPITLIAFLLFAATAGSMAGWFRERTGSLLPAIVVHMMFNIAGSLVDAVTGIFD